MTPSGTTTTDYDSLNRVVRTSSWTKETSGVELTRTVNEYDAFGNVAAQTHYDRKPDTTADITLALNAVITYTYNWYDEALRLIATAYYGTNGVDGYSSGPAPTYDPNSPVPSKYSVLLVNKGVTI